MREDQILESQKWQAFISTNVRGKKNQQALIKYVTRLIANDVVVILGFNHLSKLLGIENSILARITHSPKAFYYTFEIPKKSGAFRQISAPYPVLLNAQKWIYINVLEKQLLHESAKGFIKKISIVDNAVVHLHKNAIMKLDIENFFPSISFKRVISVFIKLGYTKKISYWLASICCLDGSLPQGGATSPALSNIISKKMDARLFGMAKKLNLAYTRYADDLSFSGDLIPTKVISYVNKIVESEGFKLNSKKTKIIRGNRQKIITGISVSSEKLTIPKIKKREVRKNIYHLLTKGVFAHQKIIGSNDPIYLERLLGYLYFWLSIEPENKYVNESIKSLKEYSMRLALPRD